MSKIEIIPDEMGGFEIYGREYQVSPATDMIMRLVDHEYDYLHYLDPEAHGITLHWLGQSALSTLAGWGICESRLRLKMPESVHEEYLSWQSTYGLGALDFETED